MVFLESPGRGRRALLDFQRGRRALSESQKGWRALLESQKGRRALLESQKGRRALLESRKGRRALLESQKGRRALLESQKGRRAPKGTMGPFGVQEKIRKHNEIKKFLFLCFPHSFPLPSLWTDGLKESGRLVRKRRG